MSCIVSECTKNRWNIVLNKQQAQALMIKHCNGKLLTAVLTNILSIFDFLKNKSSIFNSSFLFFELLEDLGSLN